MKEKLKKKKKLIIASCIAVIFLIAGGINAYANTYQVTTKYILFVSKECFYCQGMQDKTTQSLGNTFVTYDDQVDPQAFQQFNVKQIPTIVEYDQNGNEIRRLTGKLTTQSISNYFTPTTTP